MNSEFSLFSALSIALFFLSLFTESFCWHSWLYWYSRQMTGDLGCKEVIIWNWTLSHGAFYQERVQDCTVLIGSLPHHPTMTNFILYFILSILYFMFNFILTHFWHIFPISRHSLPSSGFLRYFLKQIWQKKNSGVSCWV